MENLYTLSSVGLAYDGVGVAIIGLAFFSKTIRRMLEEAGTLYGGNNALLESLIQSRTDGVTGTVLLVGGFFLQWLGVWSVNVTSEILGKYLLAALAIWVILYFSYLRKTIIAKQLEKASKLKEASRLKEASK